MPPIVTFCSCARPCGITSRFSFLVSDQRTGRPSCFAIQQITACSESAPNLAPNAPPTSGVMIRTSSGLRPRMPTRAPLVPCAPWFGIQAVSRPSSPQTAAPDRLSIGAGATRWFWMTSETTTSHPSNRSGLLSLSSPNLTTTFVSASGKSRPRSPLSAWCIVATAGRIP